MTLALERGSHTSRITSFTEPALPEEVKRQTETRVVDTADNDDPVDSYAVLESARALADQYPESAVALARLAQSEISYGHRVSAKEAALRSLDHAGGEEYGPIAASLRILTELGEGERAYGLVHTWNLPPSMLATVLAVAQTEVEIAENSLSGAEDTISKSVLGWIRLKQNDFSRAIASLRSAARSRNAPSSVYVNLGYAYAGIGSWERAIRVTRRALELNPDDRIAITNLAGFLVAVSRSEDALRVLREFNDIHRDLSTIRRQVDVELQITHDKVAAKKKLLDIRRVQSWRDASELEIAELEADIAMLQRELGEISRREAIDELTTLVQRTNYESEWIGRLVSSLLMDPSDAPLLSEIVDRMSITDERKLPLSTRLAQLSGRFDAAIELARQWVHAFPFDPGAPTELTYMLCDYTGDYEGAILAGREGLKRGPTFLPLINNLAYALASSGRTKEAKRVLVVTKEYPASLATRGLIELMEGRREDGDALYEMAAAVASAEDPELEDLIRSRWLIALTQAGYIDVNEVKKHLVLRDETITGILTSVLWQRIVDGRAQGETTPS